MSDSKTMQIWIKGRPVGIIGLQQVMEGMAEQYAGHPDAEIGAEMMRQLEQSNYIPKPSRDLYIDAFVREFKKHIGEPVEDQKVEGLRVSILGPGCARCSQMETDVREVMAELRLAGDLNHITDVREISRHGIMGVPALVINDRVVCVGQVPHRNQIKEWLNEAVSSDRKE
jgi:small redox-active disulfide protein 2